MGRRWLQSTVVLVALAVSASVLVLNPAKVHAQQASQRLILKDGSYQPVTKYEVQGDRVHYMSAERYEWEDIPTSLVDWEATKKYNDELSSGRPARHVRETPEEREDREKEEANSPEIAPGVQLPGTGGVFLFDQFEAKPEVAEILQNGSELNQTGKRNVLRAAINPAAGAKQSFEIKGAHAQIQSHVPRPVIYIDIDEGAPLQAGLGDRFRLVRAEIKKDIRVVGNLKVALSGKVTEQSNFIAATVEKMGTGAWIKLTPAQDLAPGEYALVEILGPQEMNSYVWDFGVNPKAPANPNTWRPVPAKEAADTK